MKIILLTGMTASGKSRLLCNILQTCGQPVNLICGDILQSFSNFSALTNNSLANYEELPRLISKKGAKANLYKSFDLLKTSFNAFEYAEIAKKCLSADSLNIIEGGSAFYYHYFRTLGLPGASMATFVLYFDHQAACPVLVERAKSMLLRGAMAEVSEFEAARLAAGSEARLKPIGFELLADSLRKISAAGSQGKRLKNSEVRSLLVFALKELVRQHRRYSTTQLKYMRKYLNSPGDFWINVQREPELLNFSALNLLAENSEGKAPVFDFKEKVNSKAYRQELEEELEKTIGKGFSDEEIERILGPLDERMAGSFRRKTRETWKEYDWKSREIKF